LAASGKQTVVLGLMAVMVMIAAIYFLILRDVPLRPN
jgi:hypothetical protein